MISYESLILENKIDKIQEDLKNKASHLMDTFNNIKIASTQNN